MVDMIHGAVIGYGAAHDMGKAHANLMQGTEGIECVGICDIDPERTECEPVGVTEFHDARASDVRPRPPRNQAVLEREADVDAQRIARAVRNEPA